MDNKCRATNSLLKFPQCKISINQFILLAVSELLSTCMMHYIFRKSLSRNTILCWWIVMRSCPKYTSTEQTKGKAQSNKPRISASINCLQHIHNK